MNSISATRFAPAFAIPSGAIELLKWLAVVAMVVDHVNAVFYARELGTWATAVGRIAMPVFAVVLGYNLARPRLDLVRVLHRLALFGLAAIPAYVYLFGLIGLWPLNIMWTFAVAVGVILAMERGEHVLAGVLFVAGGALVEYWWPGVALVLAAWWFFRGGALGGLLLPLALASLFLVNGNAWALLALPVVFFVAAFAPECPRSGRFFWWFYPLHLVAIALLSVPMG